MRNNKLLIIVGGIIILILILVATTLLLTNNAGKNKSDQNKTEQSNQPSQKTLDIINNSKIINLNANGFSPKEITINAGTRIIWNNKSGEKASVNSDPYPINTYWKFLNLGVFNDGQSMTLIFDKAGKYTFHNQLKPTQTGTIIVK